MLWHVAQVVSGANISSIDASEYPSDHTFFCSSQDELPAHILSVTESIHEDGSLTIQDLLMRLLERLAKKTATARRRESNEADSEDDDEVDDHDEDDEMADYELDDDFGIIGAAAGRSKLDQTVLQRCAHHSPIDSYYH